MELKTACIVHHTYTVASVVEEDLLTYLRSKKIKTYYITHPFKHARDGVPSYSTIKIYSNGRLAEYSKGISAFGFELFYFVKDFFYSIFFLLKSNEKFNVFFGFGNLNACIGIVLKIFKRVDKVVYYSLDYYPIRFNNVLLNSIFHLIDKIAVFFVDETWNLSNQMKYARIKNGMNGKKFKRQYTVPIGIWVKKITPLPLNRLHKNTLIYSGYFSDFMGIDLLISAMYELVKKNPLIRLELIGNGEQEFQLREMVESLGLTHNVHFFPWMKHRKDFLKKISYGMIGIAPFNTKILDEKVKNADPAKLKDYLSVGMPIIVTNAISNSDEIKKYKCGIIINYDKKELIDAINYLLQNKNRYIIYRKNTRKYISKFDYEDIFDKNFKRLFSVK